MTNIRMDPLFRLPLLFLSGGLCLLAGDARFNGRWDISVSREARHRAWWLEISAAETPQPSGRFVGAPGGDMDKIPELKVENGTLEFRFSRKYRAPGDDPERVRQGIYRAKLVNDHLEGSFIIDGIGEQTTWRGTRAPQIKDVDDGSWKPAEPVKLFNGRDLGGWESVGGGAIAGWTVKDGVLENSPGVRNLLSLDRFWNFLLHCEFALGPHSNSGIGLRNRYEVQILEDYGQPASVHGNGALYSRLLPSVNASRPAGEWQTMDVRLVGRTVTVTLNGKTVIDKKEIEGLTAIATDPDEAEPGQISVQGDHGAVKIRQLTITPLRQNKR